MRLARLAVISLLVILVPEPLLARDVKAGFTKATVARFPFDILPNATAPTTAATGAPADALLAGLNGSVLEHYDDISVVEIHAGDAAKLKEKGRAKTILVTLRDEFDRIFLNGKTLDARDRKDKPPPGEQYDPPYAGNEQGSWLVQFVGPVRNAWLDAIRKLGAVPVQYVSMHAYIVGARQTSVNAVAALPFVQWTSQLHRFLKPSAGARTEPSIELWIHLAQTDETADTVALLARLSQSPIQTALWSDAEVRVEGIFRTDDIDMILAQPLVIGLAERPTVGLSDERTALNLTDKIAGTGAGEYKQWLAAICPSCTNLKGDGFYVGIADTGLDGGDEHRLPTGGISGETESSGERRAELAGTNKIKWGKSFEKEIGPWQCATNSAACPDTTGSKHDTIGHGTLVAALAAGDQPFSGGTDADGFFWGLGVAPSAGIVITKVDSTKIVANPSSVRLATKNARSEVSPHAYWQNYSLNQYMKQPYQECSAYYDGTYTTLSRDFDEAVIDADPDTDGNQPITLTVSAGNVSDQARAASGCSTNRMHALPPATAKNVIAVGGAENVRPEHEQWLCAGARADDNRNLSINAKHGTKIAGWFKPDLIAPSASIGSLLSSDQVVMKNGVLGAYCQSVMGTDPTFPDPYRGATGTSFAAPVGLGAAVLASRRYSSTPGLASPALVKAMLIVGTKSMRGGKDRAAMLPWRANCPGCFLVGDRTIPRTPNGRYYEVQTVRNPGFDSTGPDEPDWPENENGTIDDGSLTWVNKGLEPGIAGFPNEQQGFGRIYLGDVLSQSPARVYVNDQVVAPGGSWSQDFAVDDPSLPVRAALVWTDPAAMFCGSVPCGALLVNHLNLSVEVRQSGSCVGRYLGNRLDANETSLWYQPCASGDDAEDTINNAEIVRFFPSSQRGDTTFTVKVGRAGGTLDQRFALVVWNARLTPPQALTATAISTTEVELTWVTSPGASLYDVERSPGTGGSYVPLACTTSPCTDTGRTPDTTYLYRVRARLDAAHSDWAVDPATTVIFADPMLTPGLTHVKAMHVTQLRQSVDAMRAAAGLGAASWTDNPLVAGVMTRGTHIAELRSALTAARNSLGLASLAYTDAPLVIGVSTVKAVHIDELRQGVR